jgi:hypothetical protein
MPIYARVADTSTGIDAQALIIPSPRLQASAKERLTQCQRGVSSACNGCASQGLGLAQGGINASFWLAAVCATCTHNLCNSYNPFDWLFGPSPRTEGGLPHMHDERPGTWRPLGLIETAQVKRAHSPRRAELSGREIQAMVVEP